MRSTTELMALGMDFSGSLASPADTPTISIAEKEKTTPVITTTSTSTPCVAKPLLHRLETDAAVGAWKMSPATTRMMPAARNSRIASTLTMAAHVSMNP